MTNPDRGMGCTLIHNVARNGYCTAHPPANLTQAQRDNIGAHTDRCKSVFHIEW